MKVVVALALCLPFYLYFFLTGLFYTCSRALYFAICHIPLVAYMILVRVRKDMRMSLDTTGLNRWPFGQYGSNKERL